MRLEINKRKGQIAWDPQISKEKQDQLIGELEIGIRIRNSFPLGAFLAVLIDPKRNSNRCENEGRVQWKHLRLKRYSERLTNQFRWKRQKCAGMDHRSASTMNSEEMIGCSEIASALEGKLLKE
jgi:hypothetical protein